MTDENTPEGTLTTEESQIDAMMEPSEEDKPEGEEGEVTAAPEDAAPEDADTDTPEEESDEDDGDEEGEDFIEAYNPEQDAFEMVPREEAKRRAMLQSDYTRKRQADAEIAKAAEAEREAYAEQRSQLQEQLAGWAINQEQEPNWGELAAQGYSPQQIFTWQTQWRQRSEKSEQAKVLWRQLQDEADAETQAEKTKRMEEAKAELLGAFPHWKDKAKAQADIAEMMTVAGELGFSEEEFAGFEDPRIIHALMELRAYRKIRTANVSAKKMANTKQTLPPGGRATRTETSKKREQDKLARVKKTQGGQDAFADWLVSG